MTTAAPSLAAEGAATTVGAGLIVSDPADAAAGPPPRVAALAADAVCALGGEATPPAGRAWLLGAPDAGADACWIAGLAALGGAARDGTYLIAEAPGGAESAEAFAYRVKRAAIALRAADPGAVVVAGPLRTPDADWLEAFAAGDAGPYVEGLAASPARIASLAAVRGRWFPGIGLWSVEPEAAAATADPALVRAARALAAGADVALVRGDAADAAVLAAFDAALPPAARPAYSPTVRAGTAQGAPVLELIGDDGTRVAVIPPHDRALSLGIGAPPAERAEWLAPGEDGPPVDAPLRPQPDGSSRVRLDPSARVTLLRIDVRPDAVVERESVERDRPGLTAAEIIAREREVRARQALSLENFQARGRTSYHFSLANFGESIDVVTENDVFGQGDALQYRQTAMFINGAAWKGPPPAFPFIASDRVTEVPLEVSLHEGYRYELEGEERESGHDCYRIRFEPGAEAATLRGTVWIDRDSFQRVRLDLIRLAPAAPVTSDALTQWFEPVDADAGSFWLPTRMEGQMVFSALSHNVVVERKIRLRDIRINPPAFDRELATALRSDDPMFRDSLSDGLVKLVPGDVPGERTVASASQTSNTLIVGGWNGSVSGSLGTPFAAINWFDMDYKGTGAQVDVAFAGLFAAVSVTLPRGTSRWETSTAVQALGIARSDRYSDLRGRVDDQDLKRLDERIDLFFRRPLGSRFTLSLNPSLSYLSVSRDPDTVPEYVLPPDALTGALGLRLDYQSSGTRLGLWSEGERRSTWGPYGLDPEAPAFTDPRRSAVRYGVQLSKNFYPRRVDRLSLALDYSDGSGLDRFSAFRTNGLDDVNVRAFRTSGLHFTRALAGDLGWAIGIGAKVRLELSTGGSYFQNPEDYGPDWQYAYGATASVVFPGPRGTLFRVRTSYGIDSSLPIDGSRGSLRVTVFKTLPGKWPWGRRHRGADHPR